MTSHRTGRARTRAWSVAAVMVLAAVSGPAVAQTAQAPVEDLIADDPEAALVEVSLGDWELKTAIAEKFSRKISDIPLTVKVSPEIASEVCPLDEGDLAQQVVISPTRTCAAKKTSDALEAELSKVMPKQ